MEEMNKTERNEMLSDDDLETVSGGRWLPRRPIAIEKAYPLVIDELYEQLQGGVKCIEPGCFATLECPSKTAIHAQGLDVAECELFCPECFGVYRCVYRSSSGQLTITHV